MANQTRYLKLLGGLTGCYQVGSHYIRLWSKRIRRTDLDVKCGIEAHAEMALGVLFKQAMEALLKYGRCKRVGNDHITICEIRQ